MKTFYKVKITKEPVGFAIRHKEPTVNGEIVIKVTDSTTSGDYKIFVVDCNKTQNKANLSIPGIEELSEEQAVELAAVYQPERIVSQFDLDTLKEEKVTTPACDLKKLIKD